MKITLTSENREDVQKVLNWASALIEGGAQCSVYIGDNAQTPLSKKPLLDAAHDVISGVHGIGQFRVDSLARAGYTLEEISAIQQIVNEIMKG